MTCGGVGDFPDYFVVEAQTRVSNSAGGKTTTWAEVVKVFGKLDLEASDEAVVGGEVQAINSGTIELLYWGSAIHTGHRLTLGSRVFNVLGVPSPERAARTGRLTVNVEERAGEQ